MRSGTALAFSQTHPETQKMPEARPKTALHGSGSLLWDNRPEFDDHHEPWLFDGPELKLEFSRVLSSRKGALALVIDAAHGAL
jgi:hypothetical protein